VFESCGRAIVRLDLGGNDLTETGAASLARIAAAAGGSGLEALVLDDNEIGDAGAAALFEALPCSALRVLSLDSTGLTDASAEPLSRALASAGIRLRKLDLAYSGLSDESAAVLADALRSNTSLTSLSVPDSELTGDGAGKIAAVLDGNVTLIALDLTSDDVDRKYDKAVSRALRVNAVLTSHGGDEAKICAKNRALWSELAAAGGWEQNVGKTGKTGNTESTADKGDKKGDGDGVDDDNNDDDDDDDDDDEDDDGDADLGAKDRLWCSAGANGLPLGDFVHDTVASLTTVAEATADGADRRGTHALIARTVALLRQDGADGEKVKDLARLVLERHANHPAADALRRVLG
jgi:Ran GTPase-activating protein (RanGAP) involved in mRNA processing and transport